MGNQRLLTGTQEDNPIVGYIFIPNLLDLHPVLEVRMVLQKELDTCEI